MLRQMWKKRVCFVLAVILAVIAVTPMEMEHTDAAMVHSVTALMTGNLVNKSNADKLTYQLEQAPSEKTVIKCLPGYPMVSLSHSSEWHTNSFSPLPHQTR